jgi:hypothetical protein
MCLISRGNFLNLYTNKTKKYLETPMRIKTPQRIYQPPVHKVTHLVLNKVIILLQNVAKSNN